MKKEKRKWFRKLLFVVQNLCCVSVYRFSAYKLLLGSKGSACIVRKLDLCFLLVFVAYQH